MSSKTLEYYNKNADQFTAETGAVEFSEVQEWFLSLLPHGALILDLGCGSGRDSLYFLRKGYRVEACDGSEEMAAAASERTGLPVRQMLFSELSETERYDGIFACASILHVPSDELPDILQRMERALKPGGAAYVSFKYGTFEGYRNGRYFTDMDEKRFAQLIAGVKNFVIAETRITSDVRPGRGEEQWLNIMLRKTSENTFNDIREVVRRLRAEDGCPWDREQTHGSLKAACIEEAAEVICGINVYEQTGNAENLKEELGDLLLQVVMHAQIAEEEGLFTLDDVVASICSKMVRRHPHVFGDTKVKDSGEVLVNWEEIKAKEKEGKEDVGSFLAKAFDEAEELINRARVRKGFKAGK